ncbi:hypothetical protein DM02DRAFT_630500 [Periconia macrospinosa]|uniref:Uncharacterized protein n=1 Tax=Periconia macrospinosa TaxID=97972 RepID=A0A2V1DJ80_9PLEO|nr:hypothetical protein DM02DRAFT_630500 [Periconia macrospinosa]
MLLNDLPNHASRLNLNPSDPKFTRLCLEGSANHTLRVSTSPAATADMPSLRNLHCSITLPEFDMVLPEGKTTCDEPIVRTHITVPPARPLPFEVRLTSSKYIAPGLSMYVFINGEYQCKLEKTGMELLRGALCETQSLVDFRVRQRLVYLEDGSIVPTEMMFEDEKNKDGEAKLNIERIEVLVLRCAGPRYARPSSLGQMQSSIDSSMHNKDNILGKRMANFGLDGANDEPDVSMGLDGVPRESHGLSHAANYYSPTRPSFNSIPSHRVPSRDPPPPPPPQYLRTALNNQQPTPAIPGQLLRGQEYGGYGNREHHVEVPSAWYKYGTGPVPRGSSHNTPLLYSYESSWVPRTQWEEHPNHGYHEAHRSPSGVHGEQHVPVPGSWPESPPKDYTSFHERTQAPDQQTQHDSSGFYGNAEWTQWKPTPKPSASVSTDGWSETDSNTDSSGTWGADDIHDSKAQLPKWSGNTSRSGRPHLSTSSEEIPIPPSWRSSSPSTVRATTTTSVRSLSSNDFHYQDPDSETGYFPSDTESEDTWTTPRPNPPPPPRPAPTAPSPNLSSSSPHFQSPPSSEGRLKDDYAKYLAGSSTTPTTTPTTLPPFIPPPHLAPPPSSPSSKQPPQPRVTHGRRLVRILPDDSKIPILPPTENTRSAIRDVWTAYSEKQPGGKSGFFDFLLGPVADGMAKKYKKERKAKKDKGSSEDKEGVLVDTTWLRGYGERRVENPSAPESTSNLPYSAYLVEGQTSASDSKSESPSDSHLSYSAYGVGVTASTSDSIMSESGSTSGLSYSAYGVGVPASVSDSRSESRSTTHEHRKHHKHHHRRHHCHHHGKSESPLSPSHSNAQIPTTHPSSPNPPLNHPQTLTPPIFPTKPPKPTPSKHSTSTSSKHTKKQQTQKIPSSPHHSNNAQNDADNTTYLIDTLEKPFAKFIFEPHHHPNASSKSSIFDDVLREAEVNERREGEEKRRNEMVGVWVNGQNRGR